MADYASIQKKLDHAREQLLDLGLRNPLLNYRTLKAKGLEIVNENPADVYRILVTEKKKMTFEEAEPQKDATRDDTKEASSEAGMDRKQAGAGDFAKEEASERVVLSRDPASWQADSDEFKADWTVPALPPEAEGAKASEAAAANRTAPPQQAKGNVKHTDSKLQTSYAAKQLESRLLNTYYYARTYVEEQGVNILYLALGMLHWYESDSSNEARQAPLVLVPLRIDRVSARERFTVAYTEDEIGSNISLAAKMKAEFALDIPVISEEGELDLDHYFGDVQTAIEGYKRWFVDTSSLVIGFFSFGKFLMYRDLDASLWPEEASPDKHPVMTALLDTGFREEPSHVSEDEHIDKFLNLNEANQVVDADSSQITAILDAMQGRNMVIQGPPGTGKSQTITNLIAEAMGEGKTVLFVSEKMAALEVVKRRLDRIGLGVACLELHSHKTNKKALLQELAATLELGKPKHDDNASIHLLEDLRQRLNDYCEAVNTPIGDTGVSPYYALGAIVRYQAGKIGNAFPAIELPQLHSWSEQENVKRVALIEELQSVVHKMGLPEQHAFWGSKRKVVLPADIERIQGMATVAAEGVQSFELLLQDYSRQCFFPLPKDARHASIYLKMLERFIQAPDLKDANLETDLWESESHAIAKLFETGEAYAKLHQQYDDMLIPEAWEQDLLETRQALVKNEGSMWRLFSGEYRKARSRMRGLLRNPKENAGALLPIADTIMESRRQRAAIEDESQLAKQLFGSAWKGAASSWERLMSLRQWMMELRQDIRGNRLPHWTYDFLALQPTKAFLQEQCEKLTTAFKAMSHALSLLEEALEFDGATRFPDKTSLQQQSFADLRKLLGIWTEQTSGLQEMASYNQLKEICVDAGLAPFVEMSRSWEEAGTSLLDCYRWNRYQSIAARAFHERPALASFDSGRHEHTIRKFAELDRYLAEYNRAKLAEAHWKRLPQYEAGGQLGVLRREFEKKTRHLPIRSLMLKAGNAIQAIKPIFMMGPLSIASYLQPGGLQFDLVIFDEASQVRPVDAFGAIIRAKQAVVVGDSKQMPPTNFFDSIASDDGWDDSDDNFVGDVESVLGLFVGQNAPQRMLRWHYRSRHESLITVSNHEFYDNKLVVFPSPDADKHQSGLIYNYLPDTAYDRGRSRTNRQEARAVAEAVMRHAELYPSLTLGVAAFSMAQMQAILDELEALRRARPSCEAYFTAHPHEPFFVKNLENVQGDERDVIFISIGYGKTSEGYLAMDFGALNREGGERRLNVLITRARLRCEVFANLQSHDIDLGRSSAQGVKALKTFLKYAESGSVDVPAETGKGFDSPFEEAVCMALRELGYEVKTQIGSAGFFVDLAVVDPEKPGKYAIGIECDGAAYHSARSARDRDRLRQDVLEGLGWTIHRIWSTDWFRHPERELKRAVDAIDRAKLSARLEGNSFMLATGSSDEPDIEREESTEVDRNYASEPYATAELDISLNDLEFQDLPLSVLASWVSQVVEIESPVHEIEVMRRICEALGIRRLTSRIHDAFEQSFALLPDIERRGAFLWLRSMETPPIRDRSELKNKKLEHVSPEELQEGLLKIVRDSFGISSDKIYTAVSNLVGFARAGDEFKQSLDEIIKRLLQEKLLAMKGETLLLA
ncbi:DUF3320 domain-containing protein [Paenibacillus sp. HB172176]|uniref:DUF3320 domain-containing protein n=1 Tax=Paenibacillus sp. HB172176 TaxID=2493690 RepID=UPI0014396235|nr:DUF3320 domain-containing protein [Paenibacillus sp. HB172176]